MLISVVPALLDTWWDCFWGGGSLTVAWLRADLWLPLLDLPVTSHSLAPLCSVVETSAQASLPSHSHAFAQAVPCLG